MIRILKNEDSLYYYHTLAASMGLLRPWDQDLWGCCKWKLGNTQ